MRSDLFAHSENRGDGEELLVVCFLFSKIMFEMIQDNDIALLEDLVSKGSKRPVNFSEVISVQMLIDECRLLGFAPLVRMVLVVNKLNKLFDQFTLTRRSDTQDDHL